MGIKFDTKVADNFLVIFPCNAWVGVIYCPPGWVFGRLIHLHSGGGENGGMFLPPPLQGVYTLEI